MSKKKTHEEFLKEVNLLYSNNEYEFLEEYIDAKTKIKVKHNCNDISFYEYKVSPSNFLKGRRCPKCSKAIKDKTTEYFKQEVFDLVDYEYEVLGEYINSQTKILMKHNSKDCNFNQFDMRPNCFLRGNRCPICSHKEGSLKITKTHKEFLEEVKTLYPNNEYEILEEYTGAFNKIKAKHNLCNNIFNLTPHSFLQGTGCPDCFGTPQKTQEQFEQEIFDLVGEEYSILDKYKNNNTRIKIRHNCEKCNNYEWDVFPGHFLRGSRCPECSKAIKTSFPEYAIIYYLKELNINYIHSYKPNWLKPSEIDIYMPSLNLGIEYDGETWHQNIKKDIRKNKLCKDNGVLLYRIREPGCPILNDNNSINFIRQNNSSIDSLENVLINIFKNIFPNKKLDINISRDNLKISNLKILLEKENSLEVTHPHLVKEWDYEKNGDLKPSQFTFGTHQKVYWKCSLGHSYKTSINHRVKDNSSCPYCSNHKVLKGFNDFETWCKENQKEYLLDEWDYSNNILKPNEVTKMSDKKVYWKCNLGHSYEASLSNRSNKNSNCPYCSNHKLLIGFNDMVTLHPKILEYWDYDRNKDYTPENWDIKKKGEFKPENILGKGNHYKAYFVDYDEPQYINTMVNRLYPKV